MGCALADIKSLVHSSFFVLRKSFRTKPNLAFFIRKFLNAYNVNCESSDKYYRDKITGGFHLDRW